VAATLASLADDRIPVEEAIRRMTDVAPAAITRLGSFPGALSKSDGEWQVTLELLYAAKAMLEDARS
jgi:hypothetical protein